MVEGDRAYCTLERFDLRTWHDPEPVKDYAALWHRLRHIRQQHRAYLEQADGASISVVLKNRWGRTLQVGMSDEGWLLILIRSDLHPTRIIRRGVPGTGRVPFLIPEWTDFERRDLLPEGDALRIMRDWLDDEGAWAKYTT